MTIWKFPIGGHAGQVKAVAMPRHARILKVGIQGSIVVWALVNATNPTEQRRLVFYGTGWDMPDDGTLHYLDTVIDDVGFVWHVFEQRG